MESAADDGEMPPLEGAEEDASRMEEVNLVILYQLHVLSFNSSWLLIIPRSTELS